jgi:hypothetical protein
MKNSGLVQFMYAQRCKKVAYTCEILCSHGGEYEDNFLGCSALLSR